MATAVPKTSPASPAKTSAPRGVLAVSEAPASVELLNASDSACSSSDEEEEGSEQLLLSKLGLVESSAGDKDTNAALPRGVVAEPDAKVATAKSGPPPSPSSSESSDEESMDTADLLMSRKFSILVESSSSPAKTPARQTQKSAGQAQGSVCQAEGLISPVQRNVKQAPGIPPVIKPVGDKNSRADDEDVSSDSSEEEDSAAELLLSKKLAAAASQQPLSTSQQQLSTSQQQLSTSEQSLSSSQQRLLGSQQPLSTSQQPLSASLRLADKSLLSSSEEEEEEGDFILQKKLENLGRSPAKTVVVNRPEPTAAETTAEAVTETVAEAGGSSGSRTSSRYC